MSYLAFKSMSYLAFKILSGILTVDGVHRVQRSHHRRETS